MKSQNTGLLVASVIFMLVALAHVARLVCPVSVQLNGHYFGRSWSVAAAVVTFVLSIWLGKLACCCDKKEEVSTLPKA